MRPFQIDCLQNTISRFGIFVKTDNKAACRELSTNFFRNAHKMFDVLQRKTSSTEFPHFDEIIFIHLIHAYEHRSITCLQIYNK